MPKYTVQCFKNGIWDEKPFVEVQADNPEQAANMVCGGPVHNKVGKIQELRAHVWLKGKTKREHLFFADPSA
jgi:hypothetical protein